MDMIGPSLKLVHPSLSSAFILSYAHETLLYNREKKNHERAKLGMGHDVEAKGVNGNREATKERIFDGIHLRIYTKQTQLLPLPIRGA